MLNLAVISVISEPTYCVLLNFLGKSQSAQDSQLFLHSELFTHDTLPTHADPICFL